MAKKTETIPAVPRLTSYREMPAWQAIKNAHRETGEEYQALVAKRDELRAIAGPDPGESDDFDAEVAAIVGDGGPQTALATARDARRELSEVEHRLQVLVAANKQRDARLEELRRSSKASITADWMPHYLALGHELRDTAIRLRSLLQREVEMRGELTRVTGDRVRDDEAAFAWPHVSGLADGPSDSSPLANYITSVSKTLDK